ncbi:hypothetical protein [Tsukamurella tyrosinosolvens]|uniref:Uncharacterized protein n=1 Tax=Tsukamurella asaccharolytica TaxID=2592067 RepID=A0A5C5R3Q6_9ACTN|nr:hypothetical protein [Tsukamurella tyrosinosolvens]KXP04254.1 hypothetical protein AXK59_12430 [Tsukamurella tyrosinosolvens]TWS17760.1 hypothetical protein FK529_18880 [Tsukamurella asaccharolytica]
MILPFIAVLAIGTLVVILWWFAAQGARQRELDRIASRRHAEVLRTRQLQRQAEAHINDVVTDALQQMTRAAVRSPHSAACLCNRCIARH